MKLTDVCDFQGGSQPPKNQWSDEPKEGYIRMLQIRDFTQDNSKVEYVKITNSTKKCEEKDILIARYGASIGKILTGLSGAYNVAMMKVVIDENIVDRKFIYNFLKSDVFQNYIKNVGQRAAQAGFNKGELSKININLPTLKEQKNVAKELDKVQEIIDTKIKQIEDLDKLIKSQFVEMFGNPIFNDKNINLIEMPNVCEIIDGDRGKNYPKAEEFFKEEYCLFLNAKNITSNGFSFENCMYITEEKDKKLKNGKLKRGDVVLTTRGTIGNLAFYTEEIPFENVRINSGMVILRMKKDIVNEIFFIEQFKMQLDNIKSKIANGSAQPQLPITKMNGIKILLPNIELQNQFADIVKQIDKQKTELQKSLEKIKKLQESLMNKYFGE